MAKNVIIDPGRLLRTSGLGAVAAALAMMTLPSHAIAQDGASRWLSTRQSAQAQPSGGNAGRGGDGGAWRGRPAAQPRGDSPRPSRPSYGIRDAANAQAARRGGEGATWRGRPPVQSRGDWSRPSQPNNGIRGAANAQAARMAEIQRRRESAGQQWSGRQDRNGRWANDRNRWRDNDRWGRDDRRWSRDWRRDNRYDWYSYRNHNRNIYRLGRYYAPYRNYSYRPVGIGFHLGSPFFGSRYWLDDPWQYRLPPADGPYRWIRYYDDALLVDTYTGEVIDVIENFFW